MAITSLSFKLSAQPSRSLG